MGPLLRRLPLLLKGHHFLALLIALGLVKGILYSVVVPLWQAPDEPKYLEYVWLLQEKGRLVSPEDAIPSMQQAIIRSMAEDNYWSLNRLPHPSPLPVSFQEVWGGANSVLGSPPLAFLFSLPAFALVSKADIAVQLYVLRLTSVLLGLAVIVMAYLIAREVFPGNNTVIWTVPSLLLFMPMYSFIANSYTNEVMSDFSAALWLYAMVVILKRGFSVSRGL
ncbi:MAG: hypothetical protein Q7R39_10840, partial [Dehalococcoidia bacterium]|nr:hypothetical protein [Dehalococcoidia bacterium]